MILPGVVTLSASRAESAAELRTFFEHAFDAALRQFHTDFLLAHEDDLDIAALDSILTYWNASRASEVDAAVQQYLTVFDRLHGRRYDGAQH